MITFTKVSLPFGWLGNMSPHPVVVDGLTWPTAEHLFQAMRFTDESVREAIRSNKSPMSAKMVAKSFAERMVVKPRSDVDVENMMFVLRRKVLQHPSLAKALIDTKDEQLVEDVSKRQNESGLFWGAVPSPSGGLLVGVNTLGKCWATIREEIRSKS